METSQVHGIHGHNPQPAAGNGSANARSRPWAGRVVHWFKETSSGRALAMVLSAAATVGMGMLAVTAAIKGVAALVFSIAAMSTGAGIPVGLMALGISAIMFAGAYGAFKAAQHTFGMARNSYQQMNQLAEAERAAARA